MLALSASYAAAPPFKLKVFVKANPTLNEKKNTLKLQYLEVMNFNHESEVKKNDIGQLRADFCFDDIWL